VSRNRFPARGTILPHRGGGAELTRSGSDLAKPVDITVCRTLRRTFHRGYASCEMHGAQHLLRMHNTPGPPSGSRENQEAFRPRIMLMMRIMNGSPRTHHGRSQFLRFVAGARGARLVLLGILFLSACDSSTSREVVEVGIPASITLEPAAFQLEEGDELGMSIVDSSQPQRSIPSGEWIEWSSSDPNVATIRNGMVRAVGPGSATLTARSGGTVATSSVLVVRTPTELELRGPASRVAPVGSVLDGPLEAVVLSRAGRPVAGAEVRFEVVAGGGTVSPIVAETDAQGIARVTWTYGLQSGPQQLAAEALHAGGAKRDIGGHAVPGPAFAVRVSPEEVELQQGIPFPFSAEFVDMYGNFVSVAEVDWNTTNPDVVQVDADGWATAVAEGEGLVVARPSASAASFSLMSQSPGNGRGNAKVRVGQGTGSGNATIAVMSGNHQRGSVGRKLPSSLSIRITDDTGAGVRHQDVKWAVASGDATLGSTSTRTNPTGRTSTSLTLGSKAGTVVVTATAGKLGSVSFEASAVPGSVARVVITPGSTSLKKGDRRQFAFSARDRFGNTVTQYPAPRWSTGDAGVATISADGVATALEGGTTTVRASVDGVGGSGVLTVAPTSPAVASVHASSRSVSFVSLGEEATVSAVARDEAGQDVSDAAFKWSSSNQGVATVSSAGKIVSRGAGSAKVVISATCCDNAKADTVSVSVTQVASHLSMDPGSLSLKVGQSRGVKVTMKDARGHDLKKPGNASWTTSNASVMTVSSTGVVKAEGPGSAVLTVTSASVSSTAQVTVTADAAPPPSGKGGAAPLYVENFAEYATVEDYLASIPHRGWAQNVAHMEMETDGPPSTSGGAIRFTYPDATARGGRGRGGRCGSTTIGYDFDLRQLVDGVPQKEIWAEYWVKYSDNWTTEPPKEWGCTGNPDHKLIFGHVFGGGGRFEVLNGNGVRDWWIATPNDIRTGPTRFYSRRNTAQKFWNNEWFQVRMHMKLSSVRGVPDGRLRVWINGELHADSGPWEINQSEIWGLGLGRNRNHHAGEAMSVSFGDFTVWNENPGW
jgi:hypothetical protein